LALTHAHAHDQWFVEQLKLAKELNKPIFLHERSAFRRFAEIMVRERECTMIVLAFRPCRSRSPIVDARACVQKENMNGLPPAVVHCFTGTREELEEYLAMGMYIGTDAPSRRHARTHVKGRLTSARSGGSGGRWRQASRAGCAMRGEGGTCRRSWAWCRSTVS
jgi:Tat protein secretion system quality control protein TatD with DNase activity